MYNVFKPRLKAPFDSEVTDFIVRSCGVFLCSTLPYRKPFIIRTVYFFPSLHRTVLIQNNNITPADHIYNRYYTKLRLIYEYQ